MLRCAVRKPDASMWGEGGQEEFVLLLADLGVRGIVAGSNYRFGYKAAGDAALLQELGLKHGLVVDIVDIVMSSDVMHGQMKRVRARGEPPPTHSGSLRPFSRQELPLNTRSTCGSPLCTAAARAAASDGCRSPLCARQLHVPPHQTAVVHPLCSPSHLNENSLRRGGGALSRETISIGTPPRASF
jgi:hypothetical protein